MRSYIRTKPYFVAAIIVVAVFAGGLAITMAEESQAEKPGGNGKCYVCHPAMKTEELTTNHLDMGITCDACHGASTEHMHDEMLMTKPDLLFGRSQVRKMCSNPTCHKPGSEREVYGRQDHKDPEAVEAFFEKWKGRMRPNGRNITHDSICTDCHGTHNIAKPLKTSAEENQAQWAPLFNGRDLKGWRAARGGSWIVKSGRLIGTGASAGDKGDSLWTEKDYEDYLLAVTFRAAWPVHAGIWSRGESSPRIEIFESGPAHTGSVLVPGKGLALVNLREDVEDRESWNTISIKVQGDRTQVWLNSEEIGVVRTVGPAKGKIGLYIARHPDSVSSELTVREMVIQPLAKSEE
ncbi:MAG: 3-keto-disaccharide hydrolase [Planctomycetota bacterium]